MNPNQTMNGLYCQPSSIQPNQQQQNYPQVISGFMSPHLLGNQGLVPPAQNYGNTSHTPGGSGGPGIIGVPTMNSYMPPHLASRSNFHLPPQMTTQNPQYQLQQQQQYYQQHQNRMQQQPMNYYQQHYQQQQQQPQPPLNYYQQHNQVPLNSTIIPNQNTNKRDRHVYNNMIAVVTGSNKSRYAPGSSAGSSSSSSGNNGEPPNKKQKKIKKQKEKEKVVLPPPPLTPEEILNRETIHYCESCEKELKGKISFDAHVAVHEQCTFEGSTFEGTKRVLWNHFQTVHGSSIGTGYKLIEVEGQEYKVLMGTSPEEIAQWRADRKKKFPTEEIVAKKEEETQALIASGALVPTPTPDEPANKKGASNKMKICHYYRRGICIHGDACEYLHPVGLLPNTSSSRDKKKNGLKVPAPLMGGLKGTLLKRLLKDDIDQEENIILQSIKYIVVEHIQKLNT